MRTSKYSKEFRESTVQLTLSSEESAAKIAADLDINVKTLYSWIQVYKKEHNIAPTQVKKHVSSESLDEENKRLRRENKILKQERDILKKATAPPRVFPRFAHSTYFAKETL